MHAKSDVDRLCMKRKEGGREGGRGRRSVEHVARGEENSLGHYVLNLKENVLRGDCVAGTIKTESNVTVKEVEKQMAEKHKQKSLEKKMQGQCSREIREKVDKEKSWYWLSKEDRKVETEASLRAAQEQALRTNYIKRQIDESIDTTPLCQMCGKCGGSVQHIVCGREKLAQKE